MLNVTRQKIIRNTGMTIAGLALLSGAGGAVYSYVNWYETTMAAPAVCPQDFKGVENDLARIRADFSTGNMNDAYSEGGWLHDDADGASGCPPHAMPAAAYYLSAMSSYKDAGNSLGGWQDGADAIKQIAAGDAAMRHVTVVNGKAAP